MNALRRALLFCFALIGMGASPTNAGIVEDVTAASEAGARALVALGYKTDFSFESIRELERFMKLNVLPDGGAGPNSELRTEVGNKLFQLGSYLGETIRRKVDGRWRGDDNDPDVTINVEVVAPNGNVIWPVQRVMKRLQNGEEDDLWAYALGVVE